jgi:membrane associated rhomboid family serine protease
MGIYDRDYIRQGPSFLGSFAERGLICKWLIGVNIVCFVLQLATRTLTSTGYDQPFTDAFLLDVGKVEQGQVWRLLTYAFLHDPFSFSHILFNMLFLWWFGSDVEDLYGPREFLAFYLSSALLGGIVFTLTHLKSGGECLGASGAVTTVLVLCALHYPTRVILVFFVLPVPIWIFVIFSVTMDLFHFVSRVQTAVAVEVHLAGAAFGYLYWKFQWRLTGLATGAIKWNKARSRPRLRVYREEEEPAATPVVPSTMTTTTTQPKPLEDDLLDDEVDAVLEKLSRVGKDNLTDNEKGILLRASEVFRRRRQ